MSHGKIRQDKNCLNCGDTVEEKFCPNCGQENIEPRRPFHYLFTHFIEDFTHYDGQFWGTIKNLLFNPGKLTKTYIEGKRQRFVPPVKLYIFISFITFFLFAVFPPFTLDFGTNNTSQSKGGKEVFNSVGVETTQRIVDSIKAQKNLTYEDSLALEKLTSSIQDSTFLGGFSSVIGADKSIEEDFAYKGHKTRKSYDSALAKNTTFLGFIDQSFAHKIFELKDKGVKKGDIYKNLAETSFHNLPKALFLYLPVFAFFLWIFHNKKKWWYFDHGVFTLHYFAFLILIILLLTFLYKAKESIGIVFITGIVNLIMIALLIYSVLYFFIAHHRVYRSHSITSILIGFVLFNINLVAFLFLVTILGVVVS